MTKEHPLEADAKAKVRKLLDRHGWFRFAPGTSMYGGNGVSDILALKRGKFAAIEVKRDTYEGRGSKRRRVSPKGSSLQEEFGEKVRLNGGWYICVDMTAATDGSLEAWLVELDKL